MGQYKCPLSTIIKKVKQFQPMQLTTDEEMVLLDIIQFLDDVGIPDHIDQKHYDTFCNKFFGQDVTNSNWRVDSDL